jgi:AraC-like DNA-binding protein
MNILFHQSIVTSLGTIECITANHSNHHFPRHFHETFPFGAVTNGILGFNYRGEKVSAWRGSINLANPGEIHDGFPLSDEGWQYRMFYVDLQFVNNITNSTQFPWFNDGVIYDPHLSASIAQFHKDIENKILNKLDIEIRLSLYLEEMIHRYTQRKLVEGDSSTNHKCIHLLMEEMRENCHLSYNLKQLAGQCGFSIGYFLRAFKQASGLTPHQFQIICRMEHARSQLIKNRPVSDVAMENGFYDQSHFYKTFKHFYGYSPASLQLS